MNPDQLAQLESVCQAFYEGTNPNQRKVLCRITHAVFRYSPPLSPHAQVFSVFCTLACLALRREQHDIGTAPSRT